MVTNFTYLSSLITDDGDVERSIVKAGEGTECNTEQSIKYYYEKS